MHVTVLGSTVCLADTGETIVPSPRDRALVAALAVDHARVRSVDELAEAVWGHPSPPNAPKLIRNRISTLRSRLGSDFIETLADGYRLGPNVEIDAERFLSGAADGAVGVDAAEGAGGVDAATLLANWSDHPFLDVEDWPPARPVITRLHLAYSILAEAVVSRDLAEGELTRAMLGAEALVALNPYREHSWILLASALYAGGRQREALAACNRARRSLGEVGLDPSPDLILTERRIVSHTPSLHVAADGEQLRRSSIGSFVGRVTDLADLEKLVKHHRLVTVVGLGGVGKTRLVTEMFHRHSDAAGAAGVAMVIADLTTTTVDAGVAEVAARALGLPTGSTPLDALMVWAVGSSTVLVLDNAEHVQRGVVELAHLLLESGPQIHIVITSRTPLDTRHEVVFPLAPLPHTEATALFEARSARPHSYDGVQRLCTSVGGIPLAIELAAGRADAVAPGELADYLAVDLSSLDRGDGQRHSSVNEVIEWSLAALTPSIREVLAALAIFRAPFTLDACRAVAITNSDDARITVLEALVTLVRHSLVQVRFEEPTRYRLLELVRQPAQALLQRSEQRGDVERRFVSWAATLVDATRMDNAASLVEDIPNLDEALNLSCQAGDVSAALRIARALMPLSIMGRTEPRAWATKALALPDASINPLFARVGGDAAWLLAMAAQIDDAREMAHRVIAQAPLNTGAGWARHALAVIDADEAEDRAALSIAIKNDDGFLELATRTTLALQCAQNRPQEALDHANASALRARRIGLPWAEQIAEYTSGVARSHSNPAECAFHLRRAQAIADSENMHHISAITRVMLLSSPEPGSSQLERDRDALERSLATGIDFLAAMVMDRIPGDLTVAGQTRAASEVSSFTSRELSLSASSGMLRLVNTNTSVRHEGVDPSGNLRSALDVLRLLGEFCS